MAVAARGCRFVSRQPQQNGFGAIPEVSQDGRTNCVEEVKDAKEWRAFEGNERGSIRKIPKAAGMRDWSENTRKEAGTKHLLAEGKLKTTKLKIESVVLGIGLQGAQGTEQG